MTASAPAILMDDVVFNREDRGRRQVIGLRPQQSAARQVGQPDGDPYALRRPAHAAFDQISDFQIHAGDCRCRSAHVAKTRDDVRRSDGEVGKAAERRCNVFADADREIVVGRLTRYAERQHRHRLTVNRRTSRRLLASPRTATPTTAAADHERVGPTSAGGGHPSPDGKFEASPRRLTALGRSMRRISPRSACCRALTTAGVKI